MGLLATIRRLVPGIVASSLVLGHMALVRAANIDVTAQIPYPIPTIAAVINSPVDGLSVDSSTQNISGTCEISVPSFIVSIWVVGQSIGSTVCQSNGTFSMTLQLMAGVSSLLPRTSNLSNIYGPDGTSISITYQPLSPPVSPQTQIPTLQTESDLSITSVLPFGMLSDTDNSVTIEIVIKGSATPFRITINWGDGASDTKSVADPGTYSFSHTYDKSATYDVRATVTDVLGVTIEYSFPVVPSSVGSAAKELAATAVASARKNSSLLPYVLGIIVLTTLTFLAGERYKTTQTAKLSKQRISTPSKKRSRRRI